MHWMSGTEEVNEEEKHLESGGRILSTFILLSAHKYAPGYVNGKRNTHNI